MTRSPAINARAARRLFTLALLAALSALASTGCASTRRSSATLTLRSSGGDATLALAPTLAALERLDEQRLVIYLTDLPQHALSAPVDQMAGSIVRIERFFEPRAGRTPLDSDAINASIRWAVLARGAVGVYEGGGLMLTERSLLSGRGARGSLLGATLRLSRATADFHDRLGAGAASGGFPLRENAAMARTLAQLLERVAGDAAPVESAPHAPQSLRSQPADGG